MEFEEAPKVGRVQEGLTLANIRQKYMHFRLTLANVRLIERSPCLTLSMICGGEDISRRMVSLMAFVTPMAIRFTLSSSRS